MAAPVMQQPGRLRRDPPLTKIRQRPPAINGAADAVDGLRQLVLLIFGCDLARSLIQVQLLLRAFDLLRLGDRRDERDPPPVIEDAVGGLAALVELPVPRRVFVRRVEDRTVEELLARHHVDLLSGPEYLELQGQRLQVTAGHLTILGGEPAPIRVRRLT